jgi:transcription elongation factor Elf1
MNGLDRFTCPVCGFSGLTEPPWSDEGGGSQEICPQCGIQFGYTDAAGGDAVKREEIYAEWRRKYLSGRAGNSAGPVFRNDP